MGFYLVLTVLCTAYDGLYLVHNIKKSNILGAVGCIIGMLALVFLGVVMFLTAK